jgi:tripartite-type tricarboxylate transporter receptor subunit TctC
VSSRIKPANTGLTFTGIFGKNRAKLFPVLRRFTPFGLISGQFDFMCDQTTNTTNQIKEGKVKGYAVTTKFKVSSVPDLPTLDSGAIPGFEVSAWHAMWAPKGLPKGVSDKLVTALQAAIKDPKVIERFSALGTEPVASALATPDALKSHLSAEVKRWDTVIKAAGVKGN